MFDFFKSKKTEKTKPVMPEVLGLRLGGAVELNVLKLRMTDDYTIFENVAKIQAIQAVGVVKLDEHSTIVRYYTDDDGFFQVILNGGMTESHIEDLKLWFFYDTQGVSGNTEWNAQLKSGISKPEHELSGQKFYRVWSDVSADSPPVSMTETTTCSDGSESTTDQFVMLYERESKPDFFEFLMLSGEEKIIDNHPERCLVFSTGINLSSADFEIIG
ncbi:hypothetical protein MNBD_GAMMA20-550 [hydrothermal vent metagenome]|uniref:DUF2491 domain-containing protein n=1 Tax=hydrothermal vent metagenome TaxID=652676 RepID=A0A3B0ZZF4_9ZZZZ